MAPKIRSPAITRVVMMGRRMQSSGRFSIAPLSALGLDRRPDFDLRARVEAELSVRHQPLADGQTLLDDGAAVYLRSQFDAPLLDRSAEHTSELQSLMRISYAVFCLKKKKTTP